MVGGMTTEHTGTERPPLSEEALIRALIRPGGFWRSIAVIQLTGSTNADLLAQAAAGAPEGSVLAAEAQTAGRARLGAAAGRRCRRRRRAGRGRPGRPPQMAE
jgi:BirA family biotin operon repressor/biotin-[acetyl-CoA-carboxylase] ligase